MRERVDVELQALFRALLRLVRIVHRARLEVEDGHAAFALSSLYIPAFITLMIEIIYFGFVLIEQGLLTKTLRKDEITRYLTYLLINAVPFGLWFGAGLSIQ